MPVRTRREVGADQPFFITQPTRLTSQYCALPEDIARYRDKYHQGWNVIAEQRHADDGNRHRASRASANEREVGRPTIFPKRWPSSGCKEINHPLPWTELSDEQREFQATKMSIHAAMVDRMDQEIGRVVEQLKKMGALDNTLILFASDNGASAEIMVRGDGHDSSVCCSSAATFLRLGPGWSSAANTPLRRHKTWVHEGGISTPLIAHWPAGIAARGELRHNPAHLIDIVPTVLELVGGQPPATVEGQPVPPPPGKSLTRVFKEDNTVPHDYLWWLHEGNFELQGAIEDRRRRVKAPWELYDLSKDRGESENLADKYLRRSVCQPPFGSNIPKHSAALLLKDLPAEQWAWN